MSSDPVITAKDNPDSASLAITETTAQQVVPGNKKDSIPDGKTNHGKLSYGITAYAGRSNTVENLINASGHTNTQSASFINDSLGPAVGHLEKPFTASYSYQAGVFVQKNISSKSSLSVGINYMYYSTKAEVNNPNSSLLLTVPDLRGGIQYITNYFE